MAEHTKVVMPQIGEGISEATIVVWHKVVGDPVEEGETLLDVTTAKIDIEIPAPADGVVSEIRFPDSATVPVDTIIAVIAPKGTKVEPTPPLEGEAKTPGELEAEEKEEEEIEELAESSAPVRVRRPEEFAAAGGASDIETERRAMLRKRSTPLVRRMARELGIDLSAIVGTGLHGRVTRGDLESYLEHKRGLARAKKAEQKSPAAVVTPSAETAEKNPESESITLTVGERRTEPMSNMRKMIAEHMERSYRRSPHAFTVFEFDFTKVEKLRRRHREAFHRQVGAKLTPLCFVIKAISEVLPRFPIITAFLREEEIVYPIETNIGVAVAVPNGLLVPVVHEVEGKSMEELAQGLQDVATRARQGKLVLSDVEGGTFTVTSPGQKGCLMGIPIINQPQSAILHIGAITKQPAVVTNEDGEDSLAIRNRAILTLGFDHRLIDGWEADGFMSALRERVEDGGFTLDQYV